MIHVVCESNLHRYGTQLDQMFALRWTNPLDRPAAAARRVDDDDDFAAVYLLDIDNQGHVAATVRLHPPGASGEPWRVSHWACRPKDDDSEDLLLAPLVLGLLEFAVACDMPGLRLAPLGDNAARRLASLGCRPRIDLTGAWAIPADASALGSLRQRTGHSDPMLAPLS